MALVPAGNLDDLAVAIPKGNYARPYCINDAKVVQSHEAELIALRKEVEVLKGSGTIPRPGVGVPVIAVLPVITGGAPLVGTQLSVDTGTWTNTPLAYLFQWLRCDSSGLNPTIIPGASASTYAVQIADVGKTLRCAVIAVNEAGQSSTATSLPTAVVTGQIGSNALRWRPPTLTSPITLQAPNQGPWAPTLNAGQDYIIKLPTAPMTRSVMNTSPMILLSGGRNIVIIGGELYHNVETGGSVTTATVQAIQLQNQSGVVHIEGVWIHGKFGQGFLFSTLNSSVFPEVQIENCRIECLHPIVDNGSYTVHTDAIQSYGGPYKFRMNKVTVKTMGTMLQLQPHNISNTFPNVGPHEYHDCDGEQLSGAGYALWKADGVTQWTTTQSGLWIKNLGNLAWGNGNDLGMITWNPPGARGFTIIGEAWNIGLRPAGDWVPAPSAGGNVGLAYVSPGYLN